MRFKKTEICQTCSKLKNVCQTCLLDLEYGLPIQVRDAALKIADQMPQSDVNKEYYIQNIEKELKNGDGTNAAGAVGKSLAASEMLSKLARTAPYYKRNRPHICSFWVKGECKRGEECPYRHDKPNEPDDPLCEQNIKDRYYGLNDPVADKILKRAASLPTLEPPEDKNITTLYIGNIGEHLTEQDIKDNFYQYGEIRSINMVSRQQCAFVQYTKRVAAELAAEKTFNKLVLGGRKLTIKWAHAQAKQTNQSSAPKINRSFDPSLVPPIPPQNAGAAGGPSISHTDYFNLNTADITVLPPGMKFNQIPQNVLSASGNLPYGSPYGLTGMGDYPVMPPPPNQDQMPSTSLHYPSQDPNRLGSHKK